MRVSHDITSTLRRAAGLGLAAIVGVGVAGRDVGAQPGAPIALAGDVHPTTLPFAVGERLTYRVRVSKVGNVGSGTMWIESTAPVRGVDAWLLRFEFAARVGPVKAEDRTASWLDARHMAALRFTKHERHPLSRFDEQVELFPGERRWTAGDGRSGESPSGAPLDELSFMYYLRTLPLDVDSTFRFSRHFEAARNPTVVRVVGREVVPTEAGSFRTLMVEMRVRDPRRYRGDGVIWINVSDDACRLPVRIQSAMPVIGSAVLTLSSYTQPPERCTARIP